VRTSTAPAHEKNGAQARPIPRWSDHQIHALVDALGNPVELMLTPGQANDLVCAQPLLEESDPEALIGDTAYDADIFIDALPERQIMPVIPSHPRRKKPRPCDFALYCERNLVERFFNKLKHFRAIATRYDKLRQKFPRRGPACLRYHSPQLKTGSSWAKKNARRDHSRAAPYCPVALEDPAGSARSV
jgi:transposase